MISMFDTKENDCLFIYKTDHIISITNRKGTGTSLEKKKKKSARVEKLKYYEF